MKRALTVILLLLLTIPSVSAGGVTYYPDRGSFEEFLASNSTYTVVPGKDYWSRGWARYVDSKLSLIKDHGSDVLVLVGNVNDNPEMAKVWKRTGLPPSESFKPSIIVLNNTVLITGTSDNIYLTEEAFTGIWRPPKTSLMVFGALFLGVFMLFLAFLSRNNGHAAKFFVLASSLVFVWLMLSQRSSPVGSSQKLFLRGLEVAVGASPRTPLEALLGGLFSVMPPVEENLWLIHWLFLLIMAGLFFYAVPREERELGFVAFGLALSAPLFRSALAPITVSAGGMTFALLILTLMINSILVPESSFLHSLVTFLLTLLTAVFNPLLLLIPLAFFATSPERLKRNAIYLFLLVVGIVVLAVLFPAWFTPPEVSFDWFELLRESLLPITALAYLWWRNERGIRARIKGPIGFLAVLVLLFLAASASGLCEPAYPYLFLAILVTWAVIQT